MIPLLRQLQLALKSSEETSFRINNQSQTQIGSYSLETVLQFQHALFAALSFSFDPLFSSFETCFIFLDAGFPFIVRSSVLLVEGRKFLLCSQELILRIVETPLRICRPGSE